MILEKMHLTGSYEWTDLPGDSLLEGKVSRRTFNRWNGHQMLFVINAYLGKTGSASAEEGKKIEQFILDRLPLDSRSEVSVLQWLETEFRKYSNQD